ncbi:MAG: hypothetical protein ABIH74_02690 [Candidatus Omnitrophota bacterium]
MNTLSDIVIFRAIFERKLSVGGMMISKIKTYMAMKKEQYVANLMQI